MVSPAFVSSFAPLHRAGSTHFAPALCTPGRQFSLARPAARRCFSACLQSRDFHPLSQPPTSPCPPEAAPSPDDAAYTPAVSDGGADSPPFASGSGGNGGSGGGGGGGDNEGDSDGDGDEAKREAALQSVLDDASKTSADVPADILSAYRAGRIPVYAITNYFVARANPVSRLLLPIGPMRDRFLADRLFLLKIAIEEGIGVFGKLSAEYQQRGSDFWRQGEYVLSNLVTAILADFALVFFPAPSLSLQKASSSGGLLAWWSSMQASLPSNIFQTDRPFTMTQRAAGFFMKFSQLFAAGLACCFAGVILTNTLVTIREKIDPDYKPLTTKHNPLKMSAAYALFLGASSGTRYQFINGIESHIFPRIFSATPAIVEEVATFGLRYANTFWGSQQWVIFCRLLKLEKVKKTTEATE